MGFWGFGVLGFWHSVISEALANHRVEKISFLVPFCSKTSEASFTIVTSLQPRFHFSEIL